jgi:hypothetical protein
MHISSIHQPSPYVARRIPLRDDIGLCTALILAAAEGDGDRCSQLLEHLFQTKQPYPFVELMVASILTNSFDVANRFLSRLSNEELLDALKTPSPLNPNQHYVLEYTFECATTNRFITKQVVVQANQHILTTVMNYFIADPSLFLKRIVNMIEFSDDEELIQSIEEVKKHSYYRYLNSSYNMQILLKSFPKESSYQVHPHKAGFKGIVLRHASCKKMRQELKIFLSIYLNALMELGQNPASPFYDPNANLNRTASIKASVQLKGQQYEIYEGVYQKVHTQFTTIMVMRNGQHSIIQGPSFNTALESLSRVLKGNRFELSNLKILNKEMTEKDHQDSSFWTNWRTTALNAWNCYKTIIHPVLSQIVNNLLTNHCPSPSPFVLEICGGAGILAQTIIENYGKTLRYILLDSNSSEISEAKAFLKESATVVKCDIVKEAFPLSEQVDIVLGSGALTLEVLKNKDDALIVLAKIWTILKCGGYVVLAGLECSLLDSSDFKKCGFEVVNTYIPGRNKELYLIHKPKGARQESEQAPFVP